MKDPYIVLGLDRDADAEALTARYEELKNRYAEDRFLPGAAGNDAAEKLSELEEAWAQVKADLNRKTREADFGGDFGYIDNLIREGRLADAQEALDAMTNHTAEWHYYQSIIFYKREWIADSKTQLELAVNMDPYNQKYRTALDRMRMIDGNPQIDPSRLGNNQQPPPAAGQGDRTCGNDCDVLLRVSLHGLLVQQRALLLTKAMRSSTFKIAVAAVGTALAAPCIILTNYVPLSVSLLTVAAVCYYIVFDKAGIVFGFLSMAAAAGLSFIGGFGAAQLLNLVLFIPYAVLAFFLRKFQFGNVKHMLIRAAIVAVFANLVFIPIYFLAGLLLVNNQALQSFFGTAGYAAVTVLFMLIVIAVDIMFAQICKLLSGKIKIGKK